MERETQSLKDRIGLLEDEKDRYYQERKEVQQKLEEALRRERDLTERLSDSPFRAGSSVTGGNYRRRASTSSGTALLERVSEGPDWDMEDIKPDKADAVGPGLAGWTARGEQPVKYGHTLKLRQECWIDGTGHYVPAQTTPGLHATRVVQYGQRSADVWKPDSDGLAATVSSSLLAQSRVAESLTVTTRW